MGGNRSHERIVPEKPIEDGQELTTIADTLIDRYPEFELAIIDVVSTFLREGEPWAIERAQDQFRHVEETATASQN